MKKIFLMLISLTAMPYLVGCGGDSGVVKNGGNSFQNANALSVNKALKNNQYLEVNTDSDETFKFSSDGSTMYGISGHTFYIYDATKVHVWLKKKEKTLYAFDTISTLELNLPHGASNLSEPYQTLESTIGISPDEKTVYLASYDPRHGGAIGYLIILDISDLKNPKIVNKDTLHLYFDALKVFPDGKHLLAVTSNDHEGLSTDLHVIDVQDSKHPKEVGSLKKEYLSDDYIEDFTISNDGKRAYVATDNTIEVISLEDLTLPIRMQVIKREYDSTLAIAITKNRNRMYVSREKVLQLFDIEDDKMNLITSYKIDGDGHYDDIENLVLSDDETSLYAACDDHDKKPDNSLVVFDITDKDKLKFKKKILSPETTLFAPFSRNQEISPDGKKFYTHSRSYYYIFNLSIK